ADDSFLILPELTGGGLLGGTAAFFDKPTPGSINGTPASLGKVADTQFSHTRGFYSAPFALTISTLTPDAQIRYTTNGSPPTATTGTVYTGPITINSTRVIRAAAFKAGWEPTNVDTQTYLFVDDIVTQSPNGEVPPGFVPTGTNGQTLNYGMDPQVVNSTNPNIGGQTVIKAALQAIPTVSLVSDPANLFSTSSGIYVNPGGRGFAWERPCSIELINDPAGGFQIDAGMRIRGGFSRSGDNPKHAFHFFFRGEYGAGKLKYPLFGREGVDEFDQIDLRTSQNYSWSFGGDSNNTFLREEFTRAAQGAMGQPYARGRYYHLYVNGQYWGLFDTEERTEASYSASYFGGDKDDYDVVKTEQTNGYTVGPTDGNLNAWQDLWNKARAHAASPTNANYFKMMGLAADGVTRTADPVLLDVDNLIDYMLLTFWTSNEDGATSAFLGNDRANNWFASRNRTGTRGFAFFAHDFEHSFGLPGSGLNGDRTGPFISPNQSNFAYSNPMFLHQDLMGNSEYKIRFADRVQKHMFHGGVLTPARVQAMITANAAIVENVIPAESARWGDSKREPALTRIEWRNARDYLLNTYAPGRGPIVLSQLRTDGLYPSLDAPTMSPFGGYITSGSEVVMSGPGTIYYTLDGTDPRLLGGGLNPNAQIYTSATSTEVLIPLGAVWRYLDNGSNQGTAWRASGFDDSTWKSGAAELGYGDTDEATRVEDNATPGYVQGDTNRYATTYFRKTFTATNVAAITSLTVKLEYDDAAVVYINGSEAGRAGNIASNPAFNLYTNAAIEDTVIDIPVNPAFLTEGNNTVAVEIHQASANSTDISFNLSLTGTRSQTATPLLLTGTGEKRLRVRARSGTVWSALDDALFLIDTVPAGIANLAITEIMYHPAPPTPAEIAAGFDDADLFEFVELTNISNGAIDLDGVYFGAGISFDFRNSALGRVLAPGASVLVVANKAAFEQRYGAGKPIAGEFSGTLDNGGELLTLFTATDATLRTLSYDDVAPWPPETDGTGYSLVLRRPQSNPDPSIAGNWRMSTAIGGTPGGSDAQTYAAWKTANNVTDDAADNDRDGLNAFLEYVLGGTIGV
ncbi:MAG TPA: CotH kinase family protein, partial [Chthoniobacteraceae bacterium]|nr:CotH kinase family protein [Chthoniobacteraceae bacterium]